MRLLRGLLVPLLVLSVITSFAPSASFATPSAVKPPENACKTKRNFCKPGRTESIGMLSTATRIFNDRLGIMTDSEGGFAIGASPDKTTGGATAASWDLSYGWPDGVSTSYTTIQVDGGNYIYGGVNGTMLEAPARIDARTNRSTWKVGDIEVTQTLQIGANSQTGQKDAAIIAYTLRNTGSAAKNVGTRVMIDTQINQNDGFPFRVPGTGIVANETEFTGAAVPDIVLAAATPTTDKYVTASLLKSGGATTPDRLVLARWSNLSNNTFDYTVNSATSLTDDSAYALYWNAKPLAAGESRSFVTVYGVGQATVNIAAPLALSVRGPASLGRVWNDYTPNPFDITATISNTGTTATAATQLTLTLPAGLSLVSGSATQAIGSLAPGQEQLVSWRVRAPLQHTRTTLSYSVAASATGVAAKTVSRSITLSDLDATRDGPFVVSDAEYRYNPRLHKDVIDICKQSSYAAAPPASCTDPDKAPVDVWARAYWPKDLSKGPYPLVVLLHGNHGTCGQLVGGVRKDYDSNYTLFGTCVAPYDIVTPNHEGYTYLAKKLASWGYIVISINANRTLTGGNNSYPASDAFGTDHGFIRSRGRLVLKHLQLWHQWNTTGSADATIFGSARSGYTTFSGATFKGKVDLGNVGLMGHSRGGQGVRSAYDQYRRSGSPWTAKVPKLGIKGIFELAPTDFTHPVAIPAFEAPGTAWSVLLPMCDGDVADLHGVRPFDRMLPNATESPATHKSVYTVWGTNHNFYNTEWQESDASGCVGTGNTALFSTAATGSANQRLTGIASVVAFFRANVGIDPESTYNLNFNPLATLPPVVTGITRVDRGYSVTPSASVSSVLEAFTNSAGTSSAGVANDKNDITIDHNVIPVINYDSDGNGTLDRRAQHHDANQRVGAITWSAAAGTTFFQANWSAAGSGRDISDHVTLDFRIARQISALNPAGPTNFAIRLAHADGSLSGPVPLSAYANLTGPVGVPGGPTFDLLHPLLQTVRIPLKDFGSAKLDQVRGVNFTFDSTTSGAIYVANMLFSRQFEPTPFPRQFVTTGATPFSVEPEQMAQPAPRPDVEIEVYSANGFPIRDAMPVLQIGDQEFILSRSKDPSNKTLIFGLTAAEFAAVQNGESMTLLYGPYAGSQEWLFAPLDKSQRRFPEQLLATQQDARDLLASLRSQATAQEQREIDAALQRLDRTLARNLWRDATHLEPASADQVFDDAQQAVTSLQGLLQSNTGTIPTAVMRGFLRTRVIHVIRGLAALAIDEAAAGQPGLDQARDALSRGDTAATNDQFVSAVQHYRSAWRQAQRTTP